MNKLCSPSAHHVFTPGTQNHMYNDKKWASVRQTLAQGRMKKNNQIQKQLVQPLTGHP